MGNFKCDKELLQKLLGEFTGTAMMMTLGCAGSMTHAEGIAHSLGFNVKSATYPLAWGLSYMTAIHTFAFISGAHLNPWVSASAAIFEMMDIPTFALYILVQFLGSLLGTAFALAVAPKSADVCLVLSGVPVGALIGIECLATAMLLFAYCAIWDKRSEGAYDSMSMRVGFLIAGLAYAIVSYNYIMCVYVFKTKSFMFRGIRPDAVSIYFVLLLRLLLL